jgi:flagellin
LIFTINNVAISADTSSGAYANTAAGMIASLQAAIDAKTDAGELAGMTFTVAQGAAGATAIKVTAVHDTANLVSNVSATPGTTTAALQINTQANASGAIATIDTAIVKVNAQRANFGAVSNRLDSTVNNLTSISSNYKLVVVGLKMQILQLKPLRWPSLRFYSKLQQRCWRRPTPRSKTC